MVFDGQFDGQPDKDIFLNVLLESKYLKIKNFFEENLTKNVFFCF
jgi:hypothetical protein